MLLIFIEDYFKTSLLAEFHFYPHEHDNFFHNNNNGLQARSYSRVGLKFFDVFFSSVYRIVDRFCRLLSSIALFLFFAFLKVLILKTILLHLMRHLLKQDTVLKSKSIKIIIHGKRALFKSPLSGVSL
jgi:hypothetical protein